MNAKNPTLAFSQTPDSGPVVSRASELPLNQQGTCHAFALTGIALYAEIDGQGQVGGRGEGKADFPDAGVALELRGVDVVAVVVPRALPSNSCSHAAPI